MTSRGVQKSLELDRKSIAGEVRRLRLDRRWTQAELAARLGTSQSRLSELEGGDGSFTAEQFLQVLRLFNADLRAFVAEEQDSESVLQNALARLGAIDVRESDRVVPSQIHADLSEVIREVLAGGEPRFLVALAPVLVRQADRINLRKVYADLSQAGLERRFAWVLENTAEAIDRAVGSHAPGAWGLLCRRAQVVFNAFLDAIPVPASSLPDVLDVIDPGIRSKETFKEVSTTGSATSRKWKIISSLQPSDFAKSLEAPHVEG
jgi:transcriptional regulator with XRE-family HTH domain